MSNPRGQRQVHRDRLHAYRSTPSQPRRAAAGVTHRDPLVTHHVLYGGPVLRVGLEHVPDQLLGLLADVAPLRVGEVVLAGPDPLLHAGRDRQAVVAVERRESAQAAGQGRAQISHRSGAEIDPRIRLVSENQRTAHRSGSEFKIGA